MIPVPGDAMRIGELVVYKSDFKGKTYVNIRKTYTDKETGANAIGKGLSLSPEQWQAFKDNFKIICEGTE